MRISTKFSLEELKRFIQQAGNKLPFFRSVAALMVSSVMKTFEAQGRPHKWPELSPRTIAGGAGYRGQKMTLKRAQTKGFSRHLAGKKILFNRGRLRNSVHGKGTVSYAELGSNLVYAAIHQYGGYAGRGRKVYIPARPFIAIQDEDRREILQQLREHLTKK